MLSGSESDMWWNPEDTVNAECQDKRWSLEGSGIGGGASYGVTANRKTKGTGRAGKREAQHRHTPYRVCYEKARGTMWLETKWYRASTTAESSGVERHRQGTRGRPRCITTPGPPS